MSRQLRCRDLWKTVAWYNHYLYHKAIPYSYKSRLWPRKQLVKWSRPIPQQWWCNGQSGHKRSSVFFYGFYIWKDRTIGHWHGGLGENFDVCGFDVRCMIFNCYLVLHTKCKSINYKKDRIKRKKERKPPALINWLSDFNIFHGFCNKALPVIKYQRFHLQNLVSE